MLAAPGAPAAFPRAPRGSHPALTFVGFPLPIPQGRSSLGQLQRQEKSGHHAEPPTPGWAQSPFVPHPAPHPQPRRENMAGEGKRERKAGRGRGPRAWKEPPRGVCSGWGQKALSRLGHGEENKAGDLLPLARAKPWGLASRGPAATSRAAPGLPFLLQASPSPP